MNTEAATVAADIAAAIQGVVPTAHANDRIVFVRPEFVEDADLGAAETQVSPSALFGTLAVTIWMD